MSAEVIEAIKYLSPHDLHRLAATLKTAPTAKAIRQRCARCPDALSTVRGLLFSPARSVTPPRRAAPKTPPPVIRRSVAPRRIMFDQ